METDKYLGDNAKDVIQSFHNIVETALRLPLLSEGVYSSSTSDMTMTLANYCLNTSTHDVFSEEFTGKVLNDFNSNVSLRKTLLTIATNFRLQLNFVYCISTKAFTDFVMNAVNSPESTKPSITKDRIYSPSLNVFSRYDAGNMAGVDFWFTCLIFYMMTIHYNDRHRESVESMQKLLSENEATSKKSR